MKLVSGLRALACIAALSLASMAAPALAAMTTDDVPAFAPYCDVVFDLASVSAAPDAGMCFDVQRALDVGDELAIVAVLDAAASRPNCSDSPAWVALDTINGVRAERLPACNPDRYDPGWRS